MPDCLAADEVVDNENIDGLVVMENVEEPYDDDDDLDDGDGGGGDFDGFEDDGWGGGGGNSRPLLEGKPQRLLKEDGSASSLRGHLLEGPKGGSLKLPGRAMKPKALPWMSAESEG